MFPKTVLLMTPVMVTASIILFSTSHPADPDGVVVCVPSTAHKCDGRQNQHINK